MTRAHPQSAANLRAGWASLPRAPRSPVSSRTPPSPVHPAAAPNAPQVRRKALEPPEFETSDELRPRRASTLAIRSVRAIMGCGEDGKSAAILPTQALASDQPTAPLRDHM